MPGWLIRRHRRGCSGAEAAQAQFFRL